MSDKKILAVEIRDPAIKAKHYRRDGYILANVYGQGKSQALVLTVAAVRNLLQNVSESTVIYLSLPDQKKEIPTLIQEIQKDPVTAAPIHLAFKKVSLKEKITASVPVILLGELKVADALPTLIHPEVTVAALPANLPQEFTIDLTQFTAIGEHFSFAQLDYDQAKVTLQVENLEEAVFTVAKHQVQEEPEEATEEADSAATNTADQANNNLETTSSADSSPTDSPVAQA